VTANPEQPILDAIDELVERQLEEGRRRGDGPGLGLAGHDADGTNTRRWQHNGRSYMTLSHGIAGPTVIVDVTTADKAPLVDWDALARTLESLSDD